MAFSSASSSQSSSINVTPLIDVLLVLLIIFMVISPVPSAGLDSQVPQGPSSASPSLPPVVLRLLPGAQPGTARYEVATQVVAHDALGARLQSMFALRQDHTLFLQADRSLSYRDVAQAVSQAREAGAGAVVVSGLHP
jgi:biopolymer transport protein ExbD